MLFVLLHSDTEPAEESIANKLYAKDLLNPVVIARGRLMKGTSY
jgi:hypothetical protein